jgi:hypothetical protein
MRRNEKRREESQARESLPSTKDLFHLMIKVGCQWEKRCDQIVQYLSSRGAGMLKTLWSRLPVRGAPK